MDGTSTSSSVVGGLYEEGKLLRVAKAYQDATDHHLRHPVLAAAPRAAAEKPALPA